MNQASTAALMSAERTYVVLASAAYSGSTLLSLLLGEHPEIATTSDVSGHRRSSRMADWGCSCGRLMRECPFWLQVQAGMGHLGVTDFDLADFRTGFDVGGSMTGRLRTGSLRWNALEGVRDRLVRRAWPGHEEEMRSVARRTRALADVVMSICGARVFVDASKERLRVRYLARYLSMSVRVIHLVRDPRGAVDSALRHREPGTETVEAAARRWASTNRVIARMRREIPAAMWTQVRYEELCSDAAGTMDRLYAFCGVRPGYPLPERREVQHILGNQMRLGAPAPIALDERWRQNLTEGEQEHILRIVDPVLGALDA